MVNWCLIFWKPTMKEDAFKVNCRDNDTDCRIEIIISAQQLRIEAHYKAEARRGWMEWKERGVF